MHSSQGHTDNPLQFLPKLNIEYIHFSKMEEDRQSLGGTGLRRNLLFRRILDLFLEIERHPTHVSLQAGPRVDPAGPYDPNTFLRRFSAQTGSTDASSLSS